MTRKILLLALAWTACGRHADTNASATSGQGQASPSAVSPGAVDAPTLPAAPPMPAAYVADLVAKAGPACRTFLRCCDDTRIRMRGIPIECERVLAQGEVTCESALRNYQKVPEPYRSHMPASCIGGVQP